LLLLQYTLQQEDRNGRPEGVSWTSTTHGSVEIDQRNCACDRARPQDHPQAAARGSSSAPHTAQISTKLDPFCEYLLARMVGEDPVSNSEVLYDEVRELGYRGGRSILKEFMHPVRALAKEKATVRFETPPGRQAQVDWAPSRSMVANESRVSR